jgi:hypothetical protein
MMPGHNPALWVCRICRSPVEVRLRKVNPAGSLVSIAGAPSLTYQPDDIIAIDGICPNGHKVVLDVTIPSDQFTWPIWRPFLDGIEELA